MSSEEEDLKHAARMLDEMVSEGVLPEPPPLPEPPAQAQSDERTDDFEAKPPDSELQDQEEFSAPTEETAAARIDELIESGALPEPPPLPEFASTETDAINRLEELVASGELPPPPPLPGEPQPSAAFGPQDSGEPQKMFAEDAQTAKDVGEYQEKTVAAQKQEQSAADVQVTQGTSAPTPDMTEYLRQILDGVNRIVEVLDRTLGR